MNNLLRRLQHGITVGSMLLAIGVGACQRPPEKQVFSAQGVVKSVAADRKSARIAHDEIAGFMQAMTMNFEVKDPALLSQVQAGDEITFTLEKTADSLYLTALSRVTTSLAEPTPQQMADAAEETPPPTTAETAFAPHPAADFTLTDQEGQPFTLSSLRGKIVLLDFIFTHCPGPCPLLSLKFSQLQKKLGDRLGKDVMLLSVTIDPRRDTPDVLKDYAKRYEANLAGWKFLTGGVGAIIMTAAAFGADYQAGAEGIIDHRLLTCVIDRDGVVVKEFTGANHTVDDLLMEIDRLRG